MALLIGGALVAVLLQTVLGVPPGAAAAASRPPPRLEATPHTATPLGLGLMGVARSPRSAVAAARRAGYLLAFEIISVHLLVVLVGAAYLARAKRTQD